GEEQAERRQADQARLGGELEDVAVGVRAPVRVGVAIVVGTPGRLVAPQAQPAERGAVAGLRRCAVSWSGATRSGARSPPAPPALTPPSVKSGAACSRNPGDTATAVAATTSPPATRPSPRRPRLRSPSSPPPASAPSHTPRQSRPAAAQAGGAGAARPPPAPRATRRAPSRTRRRASGAPTSRCRGGGRAARRRPPTRAGRSWRARR